METGFFKPLSRQMCAISRTLSEYQLRFAVKEYLEYWNHYRPHAGLNGNMILPYPQNAGDEIQEIPFLGGLLHGYRRIRQAA